MIASVYVLTRNEDDYEEMLSAHLTLVGAKKASGIKQWTEAMTGEVWHKTQRGCTWKIETVLLDI